MKNFEPADAAGSQSGLALEIDISAIIRRVASRREAHALPTGSIVGDPHGGLTFTDSVAAALEARSLGGWQEIHTPSGETWTVIVLNR